MVGQPWLKRIFSGIGIGLLLFLSIEALLRTHAEDLLSRASKILEKETNLDSSGLQRAERKLKKAIFLQPGNAQIHFAMGELGFLKGQLEKERERDPRESLQEAIAHYRMAIARNPFYAKAFFQIGYLLLFFDKVNEAELAFAKALETAPYHVWILRQVGAYQLGKWIEKSEKPFPEEVLALFGRANEADPEGIRESLCRLAPFVEEKGKLSMLVPESYEGHAAVGDFFLEAGYIPEALAHYKAADALGREQESLLGKAYCTLARELMEADAWEKSLSYFEAGKRVQGDRFKNNYALGEVYLRSGRLDKGLDFIQTMLRRYPMHYKTYRWAYRILSGSGNLEAGRMLWENFLEERPNRYTKYFLGLTQYHLGDWMKAEENIKALLKVEENAEAYYHLSLISKGLGDTRMAKLYAQQAARCQPDNLTYVKAMKEWN